MKKKIVFIPYDMDTALGTNNEGILAFDYNLEDTDHIGGADVFNGQDSVLWCNLRDAFGDEIMEMAQELAAAGLTWEEVSRRFKEHQSIWSIAIFNADAKAKYHDPLTEDNIATYVSMDQGPKTLQRDYFGSHRFAYLFSKWFAGDARKNAITLRAYATADITLTPFDDIYGHVRFGSSDVIKKCTRNTPALFECSLDNLNDTETYVYSAPSIKAIGDLSGLKVGFADFSPAINLQEIVIGNSSSSYSNPNLKELYFGNNQNLKKVDVRNCTELTMTVDLSGCTNIENVYFSGTKVTGVVLPNGAPVKNLYLPSTVTDLTLRNLTKLSTFSIAGYSNISTLRLEGNSTAVNSLTIFNGIQTGARVRILDVDWSFSSESSWTSFKNKLVQMRGLDENNNTVDKAQLSGRIFVSTLSSEDYRYMRDNYPDVIMTYTAMNHTVKYYDSDGVTVLKTASVADGASAPTYSPTKSSTAQYTYTFQGWSFALGGEVESSPYARVNSDRNLYAVWTETIRKYTVYFRNEGSTSNLQTVSNVPYGGSATYTASTPTKDGYVFDGWNPEPVNITGNTYCYATYTPLVISEITDTYAQVAASVLDGTYKNKYTLGQYMYLDDDSRVQIVGIDLDRDANGNTIPLTLRFMDAQYLQAYRSASGNNIEKFTTRDALYTSNTSETIDGTITYMKGACIEDNTSSTFPKSPEQQTVTVAYTVTANSSGELIICSWAQSYDNAVSVLTIGGTEIDLAGLSGDQRIVYRQNVSEGDVITFSVRLVSYQNSDGLWYLPTYYLYTGLVGGHYSDVTITWETEYIAAYYSGAPNGFRGIGGWKYSALRENAQTLKSSLPNEFQSIVVPSKRYSSAIEYEDGYFKVNRASSLVYDFRPEINVQTVDEIFVFGARECAVRDTSAMIYYRPNDDTEYTYSGISSAQPVYPLFNNVSNRIFTNNGNGVMTCLRDAYHESPRGNDTQKLRSLNSSGQYSYTTPSTIPSKSYFACGFCLGVPPEENNE